MHVYRLTMNHTIFIATLILLSCAITLVTTPLCRRLSHRLGLFDHPDQFRKVHVQPIPRVGGVAIFSGVLAALFVLARFEPLKTYVMSGGVLVRLIPSLAIVFLVGLLDDIFGLKPWQKIGGQLAAAGLVCATGVEIETIGGRPIIHPWQIPLTIVWLVGCTNAFNLIDGVDGLAAGVGLFATLTTLISALLHNNLALALATAPLAGALLGFLRYNFNPATIFLGDCGSLSIGFLLGCAGIIWSQKSATLLGMTAPLIALSIPIADTALSIVRRLLRGKPIFGADRRHIHHLLLDRGLTPRHVALVMYGVAGIAAACSLMVSVNDDQFGGIILILFCIAAWVGVQHLGYGEFSAARTVFFGGVIGRVINAQVSLRQMDHQLGATQRFEQRWDILTNSCRKLGFSDAGLEFNGQQWSHHVGTHRSADCWQLSVPLNGSGRAQFSVPFNFPQPATIAPFAEIVRRRMLECLPLKSGLGPSASRVAIKAAGDPGEKPVEVE